MSSKIFKHLSLTFIKAILLFHGGFIFIIFFANFTENVRKLSKYHDISTSYIITLSSLTIPSLMLELAPFIILLASLFSLRTLVLKKEIDIFKSFGISIWQCLQPFLLICMIWGLILIFIISPIAARLLHYSIQLETAPPESQKAVVINDISWIIDKHDNQKNIIMAKSLTKTKTETLLIKPTIIETTNQKFTRAIFAKNGIIKNDNLTLYDNYYKYNENAYPMYTSIITKTLNRATEKLATLSPEPRVIQVWAFPNIIINLKKLNLISNEYQVYFYNLLTLPVLLIIMLLIATNFSLYDIRKGKNLYAIFLTIVTGFLVYFFINLINVFGVSGLLNPIVAVVLAKLIMLLFATNLVYKKEGL